MRKEYLVKKVSHKLFVYWLTHSESIKLYFFNSTYNMSFKTLASLMPPICNCVRTVPKNS